MLIPGAEHFHLSILRKLKNPTKKTKNQSYKIVFSECSSSSG